MLIPLGTDHDEYDPCVFGTTQAPDSKRSKNINSLSERIFECLLGHAPAESQIRPPSIKKDGSPTRSQSHDLSACIQSIHAACGTVD